MPSIAKRNALSPIVAVEEDGSDGRSPSAATPRKRRLRSDTKDEDTMHESAISTPKRKSPRCLPNSAPPNGMLEARGEKLEKMRRSPVKKSSTKLIGKPDWNPRDLEQLSAAKEALHVSTTPFNVVCREAEQKRVFDFCKECVETGKAGSLYVCGCPGTGKSLSMEKVKQHLVVWAKENGIQPPYILTLNCTSLVSTSEIFSKIMGKNQLKKKINGSTSYLQHLQNLYSQQQQSLGMMLIIADELDYLITKDQAVLHDLFMLTTFPFSRCILIGIANAIDLADRFLPRLQSLNCKPAVITFRAYSKDQILKILQERVRALPYSVFHPQALELCARKVAAASGDMRKALCLCRSAIEILELELRDSTSHLSSNSAEDGSSHQETDPCGPLKLNENTIVRIDHMAVALSKAYRSPVVDTIQSLPQHQQIILCSAVKFFRGLKKDTTVGELNKSYSEVCKSTMVPAVGTLDFLSMCRVLSDQGLFKLGQSRDDKLKRVTLKVDEADISFALQGVRFFRNCLQ